MGVSGSVGFGVSVGLMVGEAFNWPAPFVLVAVLTILSMVGVHFLMERVSPSPAVSLTKQLASLKNRKILFAHLTMFLFLAGHTVLYTYFKPDRKSTRLNSSHVAISYAVFCLTKKNDP